jgi:hypothetical protein
LGGRAVGEEIHIAERGIHPDLDGLRVDFWAFDSRTRSERPSS